jgi:superfamily I DNA and/or RNA helicase
MIGDHQQLRPQTNSYELARKFNFNFSLFERFVNNGINFVTLNTQMRMRPEFSDLVRGVIYEDLKNGKNVLGYPNVKGMSRNFFCLNHSHPESVGINETSKENQFEAEYIVKLCNYLLESGNTCEDITVLTAYAAQGQLLRRQMKSFENMKRVRVAILDAYQGEESNIILLSLVRSNDRNDIGFLSIENRIAVILTRAKFGFYIVGNMDCLAQASPIWKKVCETLKGHRAIDDNLPSDFEINL